MSILVNTDTRVLAGTAGTAIVLASVIGAAPAAAFELSAGADPLARDIVRTCDDAITQGVVPSHDGWRITGPTPAEQLSAGGGTQYSDKTVDGVGDLHLSLTRTLIKDDRLSRCTVSVMDPARRMPIADFGMADGLAGAVSDSQATWFNRDNTMIIKAMSRTQPNGFLFSMDVVAPVTAAQ